MKLFSIDKLFFHIGGGPAALRDILIRSGQVAPSADTIQKWKERGTIPTRWIGAVMYACALVKALDPLLCLCEIEL